MGGGRATCKAARAAKLAVKKDIAQKKMEEEVRKDQSLSMKAVAENALETLNCRLRERPLLVQHLKGLLTMGAFDAVDRDVKENEEDRLPASSNKICLLSRSVLLQLICELAPHLAEFLQSTKGPKSDLVDILGFLCHVCPKSAVPTRDRSALQAWCQERFAKYGKRLSQAQVPEENTSLSVWLQKAGACYWSVDCDDQLTYVTGVKTRIPDSLVKMNVKDFVLKNGVRVGEAALCHGSLSIKCVDLWMEGESPSFDMPYFRKEIPVSPKNTKN